MSANRRSSSAGYAAAFAARLPLARTLSWLRMASCSGVVAFLVAWLMAWLVKLLGPLPLAVRPVPLDNVRLQALTQATALLAAPAVGAIRPMRYTQEGHPASVPLPSGIASVGAYSLPTAGEAGPTPVRTAASTTSAYRTRIPDIIEGDWSPAKDSDALGDLTVTARLKVLDGSSAPLRLLAVHLHDGTPRAQLQRRVASGSNGADPGWFEVGASPLAGWRLLQVLPSDVLLLTPQGNPMRLHIEAPAAAAGANAPSTPHAP